MKPIPAPSLFTRAIHKLQPAGLLAAIGGSWCACPGVRRFAPTQPQGSPWQLRGQTGAYGTLTLDVADPDRDGPRRLIKRLELQMATGGSLFIHVKAAPLPCGCMRLELEPRYDHARSAAERDLDLADLLARARADSGAQAPARREEPAPTARPSRYNDVVAAFKPARAIPAPPQPRPAPVPEPEPEPEPAAEEPAEADLDVLVEALRPPESDWIDRMEALGDANDAERAAQAAAEPAAPAKLRKPRAAPKIRPAKLEPATKPAPRARKKPAA